MPSDNIFDLEPPFEVDSDSLITQEDMRVVTTPSGQQIVSIKDCDEPTRVIPRLALGTLVRESCPHKHSTVSAMRATRSG